MTKVFPDQPLPHAIAHQGGGGEQVENTMAAFRNAYDLGLRIFETDVQISADGVLVSFHDETLDRLTNGSGPVDRLRWSQLAEIRTLDGNHPLVRLDELMAEFPDVSFNIDAKTGGAVRPLVELIQRLGRLESTVLASFSELRLREIRKRTGGEAITNVGRASSVLLTLSSIFGGRLPLPVAGDVVQFPARFGPFRYDTTRFIAEVRRRGLLVHYWTIDDADQMRQLLDLGADGLMTDRPSVLQRVLAG